MRSSRGNNVCTGTAIRKDVSYALEKRQTMSIIANHVSHTGLVYYRHNSQPNHDIRRILPRFEVIRITFGVYNLKPKTLPIQWFVMGVFIF